MKKGKRRLIVGVLLVIFLGAAGGMLSVLLQYQKSRNFYSQAAEQYTSLVLSDLPEGTEGSDTNGTLDSEGDNLADTKGKLTERAPLAVDFEALQEVNPDIIGWIYCPDTIINYPVLQGEDNDFYLHHDYEKNPLKQGSIFIDVENKKDFSDRNTIIYGHHMKDGSMFSILHSWKTQEFYEEHPVMWLLTPEQDYKIVLFSGYTASAYSDTYTIFPGETYSRSESDTKSLQERSPNAYQELQDYLDFCIRQTYFAPKEGWQELCFGEEEYRYVLLSTCAYEFDDARFVLHGVLVPVEKAQIEE